jgi:hypothetical protein
MPPKKKVDIGYNVNQFLDFDEKTGIYTVFEKSKDFVFIQNARLPVIKFVKKITKKEALTWMECMRDYMASVGDKQEAQDFFSQKVLEMKIVDLVKGNP